MKIIITSGVGAGATELSSFDTALNDAGVANYNLIYLSSIIPPKSTVVVHNKELPLHIKGKWGDKLFVVRAEYRQSQPGKEAWAGIGWVIDKKSGKGLFVEHEADNEADVKSNIQSSLKDLMKTRNIDFGQISMKIQGNRCVDKPVCSIVLAVYESEEWNNK